MQVFTIRTNCLHPHARNLRFWLTINYAGYVNVKKRQHRSKKIEIRVTESQNIEKLLDVVDGKKNNVICSGEQVNYSAEINT